MSHYSKLPLSQQLEHRELSQPYYHSDTICGSTFHGLAYTIQTLIQQNMIEQAINQVKSCINSREKEDQRRGTFSLTSTSSHQHAIKMLTNFLSQLKNISDNYYYYHEIIPQIIVKFDDMTFRFYILHNNMNIGETRFLPRYPQESQINIQVPVYELEEGEIDEREESKINGGKRRNNKKRITRYKRRCKNKKCKTKKHKKYKLTKQMR